MNKCKRKNNYFKKFPKKLLLNSQKRPESGSQLDAGSGSALNQCKSETLMKKNEDFLLT
jgi:hypothetical protein